ncbi:MAG: acylphosphatase [Chloroflexi bacterium]|nr:acylphosphatase [Chloroflexota bacterium]
MERLEARIEGRVQGVGFRHFVWQQARALGLTGWVRNRRDGSVEVVAEGPRERLDVLLAALYEGPPSAWVRSVEARWAPARGEFAEFTVRPTV